MTNSLTSYDDFKLSNEFKITNVNGDGGQFYKNLLNNISKEVVFSKSKVCERLNIPYIDGKFKVNLEKDGIKLIRMNN